MFAIAFDLVVAQVEQRHPKGVPQAYSEIRQTLERFGFQRVQGSVYVCEREDLANLFSAMNALTRLSHRVTGVTEANLTREQERRVTPEACFQHDAMWCIGQALRRTLSSSSPRPSRRRRVFDTTGRAGAAARLGEAKLRLDGVARLNRKHELRFSARSLRIGARQRDDAPRACEKGGLMALQWFAGCVRDIRAFRIEQWSDFTSTFKS